MRRILLVLSIALPVLALDLLTKQLAASRISPHESVDVLPFLHLVNVRNVGAAFGMMRGLGNVFFIAVSVAAIAMVIYLLARRSMGYAALSLILGGAIGNLTDRVMLGYVRDFVDVFVGPYHWPAFNVADSALTVGLVILIVTSFRVPEEGR